MVRLGDDEEGSAHSCTPGAGWTRRCMLKWSTAPANHTGLYSAVHVQTLAIMGRGTLINQHEV